MTDEIVRSVLPKPDRKSGGHDHPSVVAWKGLKKEFSELLATRRRIAHHPVENSMNFGALLAGMRGAAGAVNSLPVNVAAVNASFPPPESWYSIYVSQHERARGYASDLPRLTAKDLESHLTAVNALNLDLGLFFQNILTKRESPPPSPNPLPSRET
jgi:hypothetical protein